MTPPASEYPGKPSPKKPRKQVTNRWKLAKKYRKNPTKTEGILHNALLQALDPFEVTLHAQYPIGPYIADFLIMPGWLVIEADGWQHQTAERLEQDALRTKIIERKGFHVIRFNNARIQTETAKVVGEIITQYQATGEMKLRKDGSSTRITYLPPGKASGGLDARPLGFQPHAFGGGKQHW